MPLSGPNNMHLGASLGGWAARRGVKLRRTSRKPDILYLLVGTPKVAGPVLCVAILGSDVGQNRSENVGDHKLASDLAKNRSENSLT